MASEGKLATRRRPVARNMSVMDSPRKTMHSRAETRISDISCIEALMLRQQHHDQSMNDTCCGCSTHIQSHEDLLWPSSETRPDSCDYGDTASVGEFPDNHIQECGMWTNESTLERCASCISKLGALSRSSTTANTPGTGFSPAWTMDSSGPYNCRHHMNTMMNPSVTRSSVSVSSHGSGSGSGSGTGSGSNSGSAHSDYSVPRLSTTDCWSSRGTSPASVIDRCQCCPPTRPPKSAQLTLQSSAINASANTGSPIKKKPKPPMPLPMVTQPSCTCHPSPSVTTPVTNPYDNYDVPKLIQHIKEEKKMIEYNRISSCSSEEYYDTPKNIKENLIGEYGNYDTPPSAMAVRQSYLCSAGSHHNHQCARTTSDKDDARPVVCPCQRVMCWAENWMMLPYCRRGNGIENTAAPIHKVKLSGEGKMPVVNSSGEIAIYATIDKSKKTKGKSNDDQLNTSNGNDGDSNQEELGAENISSNYVNVDIVNENKPKSTDETATITTNGTNLPTDSQNYMNIDFAQSLEYYENSKDVLNRTGFTQQDFEKIALDIASTPSEEKPQPFSIDKNGIKICNKCGHACASNNGPQDPTPPKTKQDDYLMMEPASNHKSQTDVVHDVMNRSIPGKNFPGYLPMHPITSNSGSVSKPDLLKLKLNRETGLLGEKAASIPSLSGPIVDRCRKRSETEFQRIPGSAMLGVNHSVSATSSPYMRRHAMNCANDKDDSRFNILARKRSSSADSTRYLDDLESITERTVSSSPTQVNNSGSSKNTSIDSLSSHTLSLKRTNDVPTSTANSLSNIAPCGDEVARQIINPESQNESENENTVNGSLRTLVRECLDQQGSTASVHIRRSSSVPCKSGNNRDSSSSNDSGVSTGSLKHRGADFAEFELPLTTSMSTRRHHHAVTQRLNASNHMDCLHASLPRRSKSSDPLRELTFQFQKIKIPAKSSSAEAEIPVFPQKRDRKGCTSPNGDGAIVVPYIDSRSTSSGTSDMSDYIETLSLSSHSSSDTPDSLRMGRPAATTLRPRSGKEYHKIDRYILEGDLKKNLYTNITPVPEKCESPSPGYMSSSPGQ